MPLLEVFATLAGLIGSYLVYFSWKRHSHSIAALGWTCLMASLPLWILAQGPEFGVIYGLSLPALYVWLGVLKEQKWQGSVKVIPKDTTQWCWNGRKVAINFAIALYMLPGLMVLSSVMTTSAVYLLPTSEANQMAIGIIALPVLWGCLAHWYLVSVNKRPPLLITFIGAGLSAFHLFG